MKVINNVRDEHYDQWLTGYVKKIIKRSKINCNEVSIYNFDGKLIGISVDGDEDRYKIMINGSDWVNLDQNELPYEAKLRYVLFELNGNTYTGFLDGAYKVRWNNYFEEFFKEEAIERFGLSALEQAGIDIEKVEYKWSSHNCIAFESDDTDYRISVLAFPPAKRDEEGMPIVFHIIYDIGKIVSDKTIPCGVLVSIEQGEAVLSMVTEACIAENCA